MKNWSHWIFFGCLVQTFTQTLRILLRFCSDICQKYWPLGPLGGITWDKTSYPVGADKMPSFCRRYLMLKAAFILNYPLLPSFPFKSAKQIPDWTNWIARQLYFLSGCRALLVLSCSQYCTKNEDIFIPITEANCTFHHTFISAKAVKLALNDFSKVFALALFCLSSLKVLSPSRIIVLLFKYCV